MNRRAFLKNSAAAAVAVSIPFSLPGLSPIENGPNTEAATRLVSGEWIWINPYRDQWFWVHRKYANKILGFERQMERELILALGSHPKPTKLGVWYRDRS